MSVEVLLSSPINAAIIGGALIGLASGGYYLLAGRISGISGIFADGFMKSVQLWRYAFLAGLIIAGLFAERFDNFGKIELGSLPILLVSGLLVGFGTRMGNGCTSGHGVCGISRFSVRSFIAVGVFMVFAALTVFLARILGSVA